MKIINPSFEFIDKIDGDAVLKKIEICGRICYKSEDRITNESAKKFIATLIKNGHESVLEHASVSIKIICDRGVTHEIVRHRIASYSQESTRYCNYSEHSFGSEITVIKPFYWIDNIKEYENWKAAMATLEKTYFDLLNSGSHPQEARSVLPNSLKTEIIITMNMREWRHFFKLRCAKQAHPQMRQVAIPLLLEFQRILPILFNDIDFDKDFSSLQYAKRISN